MDILSNFNWAWFLASAVFIIGYTAIIMEFTLKVNKTAVAILIAILCWTIYFFYTTQSPSVNIESLNEHVSEIAQIIFFLLGAMTIVELIDSHRGFKTITRFIHTISRRKMLWMVAFFAFFLSSILDNLTTTILMISLLRKLVYHKGDRLLLGCVVVAAANAGGAWTPIGDVTTTMLWIHGQISSFVTIKKLFLPSLVSILVPLGIYSIFFKGKFEKSSVDLEEEKEEPGARLVFYLGVGSLIFIPVFKGLTGLPPFMGALIGLSVLWLVTDLMHYKFEKRSHLRVPFILTKIDASSILFFLGILLSVAALDIMGILKEISIFLDQYIGNQAMIATLIGLLSALIDNVPLVAATMGMYDLAIYPMDSSFWLMIAYAAGTGGSILLIGSSSGVAFMGMEKIDFMTYLKKASLPILIGYLAGMGCYLLLS